MTGKSPYPCKRKSLEVWSFLFLLFSSFGQIQAIENEIWNRSLSFFDQNKFEEACKLLETEVSSNSPSSSSPALHFNYSLCSWKAEQTDTAVFHLLKSSLMSSSPQQIWSNLELARAYQMEIGISNNLVNNLSFTLLLYAQENYLILLGCLAIWCLFLDLSFPKLFPHSRILFRSIFIFSWLSVGTLILNQKMCGKVAVLFGNEPIGVFSKKDGKPEKLADLPRGTIVSYGKESDDYTLILKPISGWVKSKQIKDIHS